MTRVLKQLATFAVRVKVLRVARSHPPFVNVSPASMETGVEATLAAARPRRAKRNDETPLPLPFLIV